jgi:hypothetical protein
MVVIVMGPFEVGTGVGVEVSDVTAVGTMLRVSVPVVFALAMIVVVIVIMIMVGVGRSLTGHWLCVLLCLASEHQGSRADEKCRKEKLKFHSSAHPVLESPEQNRYLAKR